MRSVFSQKRFWRNSTGECREVDRLGYVGKKQMCGQNPEKNYFPSIGMRPTMTRGCADPKLRELNPHQPLASRESVLEHEVA